MAHLVRLCLWPFSIANSLPERVRIFDPGLRKHQTLKFSAILTTILTAIWDAFCTASCDSDFSGLYSRLGGRGFFLGLVMETENFRGPKDDHTTGLAHFGVPWQHWDMCVCHKWMGILYILYISLYIMLYNYIYIYTQYNWHKITITYVY